jgi:hypothetical protein
LIPLLGAVVTGTAEQLGSELFLGLFGPTPMRLPDAFAVGTPRIGARILFIIVLKETQTFAVDQVLADIRLLLLSVLIAINGIDWLVHLLAANLSQVLRFNSNPKYIICPT